MPIIGPFQPLAKLRTISENWKKISVLILKAELTNKQTVIPNIFALIRNFYRRFVHMHIGAILYVKKNPCMLVGTTQTRPIIMICDLNTRWGPLHPAGRPIHIKDLFRKVFLFSCFFIRNQNCENYTKKLRISHILFHRFTKNRFLVFFEIFLPLLIGRQYVLLSCSTKAEFFIQISVSLFYYRLTLSKQYFIFPEPSKFVTSNPWSSTNAFIKRISPCKKGWNIAMSLILSRLFFKDVCIDM